MVKLRTPISYPGGKSLAVKHLMKMLPESFSEYREPFLGGGSMAIAIAQAYPEIPIWINELYEPLFNFWRVLKNPIMNIRMVGYCREIREKVLKESGLAEGDIPRQGDDKDKEIQKILSPHIKSQMVKSFEEMNYGGNNSEYRAANFLALSKGSYGGIVTGDKNLSPAKFIRDFRSTLFDRIPLYSELMETWRVSNSDYKYLLEQPSYGNAFVYLDPPYKDVVGADLYGDKGSLHKVFSHEEFYVAVKSCDHKMMISYDCNPDHSAGLIGPFREDRVTFNYSMGKVGSRPPKEEVVFTNYSF